jgi:hypothetical protein
MEVWYGTIYTLYHKKDPPKEVLKLLSLYQPIAGAVKATGVLLAAAKSNGKLWAFLSCRCCYRKGSLSFTSYYY